MQCCAGGWGPPSPSTSQAPSNLLPVALPLALEGSSKDYAELANQIIQALMQGADPQTAHQALGALVNASKVHELFAFEARIKALEDGVERP